ncbi:MAG: hypothetical protein GY850_25220 [bacterium]|nr:hypothetical protein [bacterium]
MKITITAIILFLSIPVVCGAAGAAAGQAGNAAAATCICFADSGMTEWSGCDSGAPAVLVFDAGLETVIEDAPVRERYYAYVEMMTLKIDKDRLDRLLETFSARERLEIDVFKVMRTKPAVTELLLPVIMQGFFPVAALFEVDEQGVYVHNPSSGEALYLKNVDYLKFKHFPLIPVPGY